MIFSDWIDFFWQQINQPMAVIPDVYNLPWLFILLQPLRLIGETPAVLLIQIISLFVIYKMTRFLHLSVFRTILVFLSAPVFWNFFMGQIDGLMIVAYFAPPLLASFLTICKPQTCLAAGWSAFRKQPYRVAILVAVAVLSAYIIWRWPISISNESKYFDTIHPLLPAILVQKWNWSLWPWGFLLIPLIIRDPEVSGLFASPLIFPYAGLQSLIGPVLVGAKVLPIWFFLLFWIGLWIRWMWMLNFI